MSTKESFQCFNVFASLLIYNKLSLINYDKLIVAFDVDDASAIQLHLQLTTSVRSCTIFSFNLLCVQVQLNWKHQQNIFEEWNSILYYRL